MSSKFRLSCKDLSWVSALTLTIHKGLDEAMDIFKNIFPSNIVDRKSDLAWDRGYIEFGEITRKGVEYVDKLNALNNERMMLKAVNDHPITKDIVDDYDVDSLDYIYYNPKYFNMTEESIRLSKRGKGYLKHLTEMLSVDTNLQCKDLDNDKLRELGVTKAELYTIFPTKIVDLKFKS